MGFMKIEFFKSKLLANEAKTVLKKRQMDWNYVFKQF